ncbi:PAS domain-containing protein [Heliobacterium chlorum]|uniref:histidine kinase n=1 Tax=Heliobacterium chlorum TaxID=2698 RepID=A0ABR7T135_HELCL|nr:HAMP domain-containing sensor histidine kinase [Heliobacterium chlorum]MBC9783276.1 PAS domain-containing protein [Heliobacterium chlorum]
MGRDHFAERLLKLARGSLQWKLTFTYILLVMLPLSWLYFFHNENNMGFTGLMATLFFFFCFSAGVVYVWAGQLAHTLNELTRVVSRMESGQASRYYWLVQPDELGTLAQTINQTVESVRTSIHGLHQEKTKFETILESMVEGVIGFDQMGRILLVNRAAERMLRIRSDQAMGKLMVEVFRHRGLDELLEISLRSGELVKQEIHLWPNRAQTYRVQVVPVWAENRRLLGAAMVIDDVTEVRRLEQMRTEFVANVSHELRTPLTSIKGFVETLLDGALENPVISRRFLTIIDEEAQRLQRLIEDLLYLSRIESYGDIVQGEARVEPEAIQVKNLLEPIAADKNITLHVAIEKELPSVPLSKDNLKQVLVNLVENAIKYTPKGGQVWFSIRLVDVDVLIEVRDTGIGIPEESLPRIFERFYRVDKTRSREMGGTGLGLAIVKHIVEKSGGQVRVNSKIGEGTTFVVSLPVVKETELPVK